MDNYFLFFIEVIGTIAFAISGIRMAAAKNFDWFGAYTVGLVTAIGGGTVRDVLLDIPVFWMQTWWYLAVTGLAFVIVVIFKKLSLKRDRALFIFDTIGLALFVVIGAISRMGKRITVSRRRGSLRPMVWMIRRSISV